ncbi:TraB/GumN family protein [Evansella clarkii]|uniref:TraB/GumN family protein n=1 Tax=Evansella clarkii TaxID=79879 RepID=UPI000B4519F2|nr:TraB/GumN family protein [Evansella clarkii]
MKQLPIIFFTAIIFLILTGCNGEDERVAFEDSQLEAAVMAEISSEEESITPEEAASLTELDAAGRGIESLDGIEALTSLEILDISDNNISDFSPLTELEQLEMVFVMNNPVDLEENPDLSALAGNGVTIEYEEEEVEEVVFNETGPPSEGVFYKIEEGSNTVYLFGSIHVGMADIYPLHEEIESAFAEADYLAVEIDMTEINEFEMAQQMSQQAVFVDGRTLSDVIGDDLFEQTLEKTRSFGFNAEILEMYKPWFVATLVSNLAIMEAGYTDEYGIDNYFMDRADGQIDIIGLETVEDQLGVFNVLSMESQREYLAETLEEYDAVSEEMDELMAVWRAGDTETLSENREIDESWSDDYQEFMRAMQDDRDEDMAEKIEEFLLGDNGETYFVVVGALHLVGETSITGLLEEQGYEIEEGIQ